MTDKLYIGLMSGTSMDGIDAVLVEFGSASCRVHATHYQPYSVSLQKRLLEMVRNPAATSLQEVAVANQHVADEFSDAVSQLMALADIPADRVCAIGSHGQTVLHQPDGDPAFTVQLGDAAKIAVRTGIQVVAQFRSGDLALGGQGAPLVPAFHRWAFGSPEHARAVVNIGGIANITLLQPDGRTGGFDTGPGNILLDYWCREHRGGAFDDDGAWASGGQVDAALLELLSRDPFFSLPPPKSTGADYFNAEWLRHNIKQCASQPSHQDVQTTLSQLTAEQIASGVGQAKELAVCGGGARNRDLVERISRALSGCSVASTDDWGIDPDWVEAIAFAWLARQRLDGRPTNVPTVTGASDEISLGAVFLPPAR